MLLRRRIRRGQVSCSKSHVHLRISTRGFSIPDTEFSRLSLLAPLNISHARFSVFRWKSRRPLQSFQRHRSPHVNERLVQTDQSPLLLLDGHRYGFGSAASFNFCEGIKTLTVVSTRAVYSPGCLILSINAQEMGVSEAKLRIMGLRMSESRFSFRNRTQDDNKDERLQQFPAHIFYTVHVTGW